MTRSPEKLQGKKQLDSFTLTDAQFDELKSIFRDYLKIVAMTAIKDTGEEALERNVRILHTAGFAQKEIGKILHVSQPTVSRALAGVWEPKRRTGKENE
jgi:predicted XRE-type DNA-binding protein